jgi:hypothetical protein
MIAQSQSGTGKTAAFVLAMLSRVDPSKPYPQVGGTFPYNALKMAMAHWARDSHKCRHERGEEEHLLLTTVPNDEKE